MVKKTHKVIVRGDIAPELREVKGYFTWLNDLRVFIYFDYKYRKWYVIDLDTGQAFADGISMTKAKEEAYNLMNKFIDYKKSDNYKQKRFLYQKLLKEENEV